jgi:hypothetical protein
MLAAAVFCGCTPRAYLAGQIGRILDDGMAAFEADDDLVLLESALPADIKLLEALLASSPHDTRLLALLSRLYASYAFAFLETGLERSLMAAEGCVPLPPTCSRTAPAAERESVARYYRKGMQYARRALQSGRAGWPDTIGSPRDLERHLSALQPADVPALFWYAFTLGAFIRLAPDAIRTASQAYIVPAAMQRSIDLDPAYYHGAAHLVLLAYHARPPAVGGDPAAAQRHYGALKAIAGEDFLLADVFYARFLLYQQQDRAGFEKKLAAVLAHPRLPGPHALLDEVARRRAALYLEAVECLFF